MAVFQKKGETDDFVVRGNISIPSLTPVSIRNRTVEEVLNFFFVLSTPTFFVSSFTECLHERSLGVLRAVSHDRRDREIR